MVAIALVLILAALILALGAVVGGSASTDFDIFRGTVTATGTEIFLLGLATGLMLVLGLGTLRIGARRAVIRRKELRALRATHEQERKELAAEREALEAEREELAQRKLESDPAQTEPAQTEPTQTEPAQTEPAQTERLADR